jgi:hypothetical protein
VTRQDDTGNHCVSQFTWTPVLMPQCHQITGLLSGDCTKRSNSSLDFVHKGLFESLNQSGASFPDG